MQRRLQARVFPGAPGLAPLAVIGAVAPDSPDHAPRVLQAPELVSEPEGDVE